MTLAELMGQNSFSIVAGVAPRRDDVECALGLRPRALAPAATDATPADVDKLLEGVSTDLVSEADRAALRAAPLAAKKFAEKLASWRESNRERDAKLAADQAAAHADAAQRERARLVNLSYEVAKAERAK